MVRYLITSGTSKTGAATIKRLRELGVSRDDIVAGSRDPTATEARLKELGAGYVVQLDHLNEESIKQAMVGIDRVGLMQGSESLLPIYSLFRSVLPKTSVKSIVAIGGTIGGTSPTAVDFEKAEKAILETPGIETTIVAPNWFFENWRLREASEQLEAGFFHGAAKDGKVAYIAVQDIGNTIAQILFDGPALWNGQRLYITGPESFTEQEVLTHIGTVVYGHPIEYRSLESSAYLDFLLKAGAPEHIATLLRDLEETKVDGYTAKTSPNMVKLVTGKDPISLAQWTAEWAQTIKK